MTPAEIEPATFRLVSQRLNHCATARMANYSLKIKGKMLHIEAILHFHTDRRAMIDLLKPGYIVHVTASSDEGN